MRATNRRYGGKNSSSFDNIPANGANLDRKPEPVRLGRRETDEGEEDGFQPDHSKSAIFRYSPRGNRRIARPVDRDEYHGFQALPAAYRLRRMAVSIEFPSLRLTLPRAERPHEHLMGAEATVLSQPIPDILGIRTLPKDPAASNGAAAHLFSMAHAPDNAAPFRVLRRLSAPSLAVEVE
jgi:hypothetical protein